MKKSIVALSLLLCFTGAQAQVKEERAVKDFNGLKVGSAIRVVLTMSDKESLTFEAEADVLPKLTAEVEDGILCIGSKGNTESKKPMIAYVSARSLKSIDVTGASEVELTNVLETEKLSLELSGAAELDLNLKVKKLDAEVEGAADVEIKGSAGMLSLDLSGAAKFKSSDLSAGDVKIKASGAAHAKVQAAGMLKVNASGASKVIYSGTPKDKNIYTSGAASVKAS